MTRKQVFIGELIRLQVNLHWVSNKFKKEKRFINYYNTSYLERKVKGNNSIIYKSLLKHGYPHFTLDILEYCSIEDLISREQYYLNNLNPEHNILKTAGSLLGFKHSEATIDIMRNAKLGKTRSEKAIAQIEKGNIQAQVVLVTNKDTK